VEEMKQHHTPTDAEPKAYGNDDDDDDDDKY